MIQLFRLISIVIAYVFLMAPVIAGADYRDTARDSVGNEYLVVINADTIHVADMDRALVTLHGTMSTNKKLDFDYRNLLNKLVNDKLIVQEATALGMDKEPSLTALLDSMLTQKAAKLYVKDNYQPDLQSSDAEVLEYFEKYYARLQVRTIAAPDSATADKYRTLISGGANMDSLARAESLDTYRYTGGLHGNKRYGDVAVNLRDQADSLPVGELSRPFPFRQAYLILRVESRTPADTTELESSRDDIASILRYRKHDDQWKSFVTELESKFPAHIDSQVLDAILRDSTDLFTETFTSGSDQAVFYTEDGQRLSDEYFRSSLSRKAMSMGTAGFATIYENTKEKLFEQMALTSAARAAGYLDRPELLQAYETSRDSALVEIYLKETVASQIVFRHDEFEAYYNERLEQFREPGACQFDRLTVDSADMADQIAERIADGGDFYFVGKQFAARLSTPETAAEWVEIQTFPEDIREEIQGMRIGATTKPHRTTDGWLILRLKGRRPGKVRPLEDVEMTIRQKMFQEKFSERLDEILAVLKEHSKIEFHEQAIERYFGSEVNDES